MDKLKKGTRLKKRYEIVSVLGEGGFGCTYKAIDHLLNRFVAIKSSSESMALESKILKELANVPHISHRYDHFSENGTRYIAMRLISGKSLSQYQKENGGTINVAMIKRLLPSALVTLGQMHERGVVHLDISPGNYIVGEDGILYLIDFGSASSITNSKLRNKRITDHKGLDAPEHTRPDMHGPWTDIYSLCATIVYLLTGSGIGPASDRASYDPLPEILRGASISGKMQNALMKGLSIDIEKRYKNVQAFARDFLGDEKEGMVVEKSFQVAYSAKTLTGERPVNQDNFMIDNIFAYAGEDCEIKGHIECVEDEIQVVAVADGVATSMHGELASKAAIQAVSHMIDNYKRDDGLPRNILEEFINQLNEKIIALGKKIGKTASTISIFMWKNNEYYVANIGDSPIYKLSDGKVTCISKSHTVAKDMLEKGMDVSAKDLHSITKYLGKKGVAGSEMAYITQGMIMPGDTFLICTDGIGVVTTDIEKKKALKNDCDKAVEKLFKYAQRHSKMDNSTAIVIKF